MRTLALLGFALLWATPALAQMVPTELPSDERIKLLSYDESDVYTITTKFGYQTNIVFAANESINTISVGDRSLWQIIPSANRLFIRPMQQGISTNMTILTNKRSYQFDLKSLGAEEKSAAPVYVAKFVYMSDRARSRPPADIPVKIAPPSPPVTAPPTMIESSPPPVFAETAPPSALPPKPATTYTNYNYTYSGPDELAPLQVFDNGKTTFIKYVKLPDPLPQIYTVDAAGKRSLMVPERQDNMLAAHIIAGTFAIQHASGTIMVYNEMLNPGK